jgi:RHS repeat-associated protein
MSKSINSSVTQFMYDGWNPMQELNGANPPSVTANLLTGLKVDEYFTRSDSGGAMALLRDALGSTIGLVNSAGAINTSYTYEPFGNTTVSGTNSNPYQFPGRENDGSGLYYYRARYYSPTFQRFIAQDPIGLAGGDPSLYGYVRQAPTNITDPTGLCGDHPCFGWGRVLQGNSANIGSNGAFGTPVQSGTGDIAPEQFGYPNGPGTFSVFQ